MKLQVLVATMNNLNVEKLYNDMNLKTDALIINQSDFFEYECKEVNGSTLECYTFNERGLSKSRNNALLRCSGDIICFADDDMVYTETYENDIINEFEKHPNADAIVFNVPSNSTSRTGKEIKKFARVSEFESREYGSVHIAIKRDALISRNVYFNILFGSGSVYKCGEDTIFLKELFDKKIKLYKSPVVIGTVDMSESTWFDGYNEKYFFDKGAIIACAYPKIKYFLILVQALKNSKKKLGSYKNFFKLYKWYLKGAVDYKNKKNSEV
jgi:glycosyltransferase involved in cell wall biosynthesis